MKELIVNIIIVENEDIPFKERICINIQDEDIINTNLIHVYDFIMNQNIIKSDIIICDIFFYNMFNFLIDQSIDPYDINTYLGDIKTNDLLLLIQL